MKLISINNDLNCPFTLHYAAMKLNKKMKYGECSQPHTKYIKRGSMKYFDVYALAAVTKAKATKERIDTDLSVVKRFIVVLVVALCMHSKTQTILLIE